MQLLRDQLHRHCPCVLMGDVLLCHGDCERLLAVARSMIDAVVSDPPYGIDFQTTDTGGVGSFHAEPTASRQTKRITGDDRPFDPTHLFEYDNLLLWGANHFAKRLPDYGRWLAWDKLEGREQFDSFSDVEFAWHSKGKASRIISYLWKGTVCRKVGESNGIRYHPHQKPIGVMQWCLDIAGVNEGQVVADPYMGSGTTAIACIRAGCAFIGFDIDEDSYRIACDRVTEEQNRHPLFD